MRDDREIEAAIDALDNRLERVAESDHPFVPILQSVYQAKRGALLNVRDASNGEHIELRSQLAQSLAQDMSLVDYVQTQSMLNSIDWAENEREDI